MKKNQKQRKFEMLLIVLLVITIGFAVLRATLGINGTARIKGGIVDIQWDPDSIEVTSGSKTTTLPTMSDDGETISYAAELEMPGDFYEFTIDVINEGTASGMIAVESLTPIVKNEDDEVVSLPENVIYTIKYEDGGEIEKSDLLAKGKRETFRVRIEYDINAETPLVEQALTVEIGIPYERANNSAIDRDENKYIIDFNPNGGTLKKKQMKIIKETAIGELPVPTRDGYTFTGWYTSAENGTEITEETIPTQDTIYYAHWTEN